MLRSKPLKDFDIKQRSKLYETVIEPLVDWYHKAHWATIGKPWSHAKKMWGWYFNVFRWDYDFDSHSIFSIIEYKLIRVQKSLLNGCAWQENRDMKALRLAIKLAGRLKEDKYDERGYNRIDRKYGKAKYWTEPCNDTPGVELYSFKSSRPKVKTKEEEKELSEYSMKQYLLADDRMKREEKLLYSILHKYLRVWWD